MVQVLELTADIKNPHADRRSKDWNKLPVLYKGTRFTKHEGSDYDYFYASESRYHSEPVHSELGKLIMVNAILVAPQSFTEMSRVYGDDHDPRTVAETLFKLGRLDIADFRAVASYFNEQDRNQ